VRSVLKKEWDRGVYWEIPDGCMERRDIPRRGVGYVALRHVAPGRTVLFDTAFWTTARHPFPTETPETASLLNAWHLRAGIDDPSRLERFEDVLLMAGARDDEMSPGENLTDTLLRVLERNQIGYGPDHTALFPAFARLNHSCAPNCAWHGDGSEMVVNSIVDIKPGEEVCVSYLPQYVIDAGFQTRRRVLQEKWGFSCNCNQCELDT